MKDKKISTLSLLAVMLMAILINQSIGQFSADYYFLVATGREIVHNGIPHTNPWFVDEGLPIVIQQWLYDVYIYLLDRLGNWSITVSICLMQFIFVGIAYKFLSINNRDKCKEDSRLLASILALLFGGFYVKSIRPEMITVILLMLQILYLEKYKQSSNKVELLKIVVLNVVEANIHSSMCIMHYAIIIAYIFPGLKKLMDNDSLCKIGKDYIKWLMFLAVMIASSCINPYGYHIITYTLEAVLADTFDLMPISEMQKTVLLTDAGIILLVHMLILTIVMCKNRMRSSSVYTCIGIILCEMMAYRNTMFAPIVNVILLNELIPVIDVSILNRHKHISKVVSLLCIVTALVTFTKLITQINSKFNFDIAGYADVEKAEDVLEHYDISKDTPIYTDMNYTSYFEYIGYTKLYIDARPELFVDRGKHVESLEDNILLEYNIYFSNGSTIDDEGNLKVITNNDIDEIVDYYGFKCFIVAYGDRMYSYLYDNSKYEYIDIPDSDIGVWIRRD